MQTPFRRLAFLGVLLLPLALVACDTEDDGTDDLDVVGVAQADADLEILVDALVAAGLVDDLEADGPFTVFAPTDDAFGDALVALGLTAEELLASPDLDEILLFHVAAGELSADDLDDGEVVETLSGEELEVIETDDGIFLDTDADGDADAEVIDANIEAENGIIHKIDAVLLPPGL